MGDTIALKLGSDAAESQTLAKGNLLLSAIGARPTVMAKVAQRTSLGTVSTILNAILAPPPPATNESAPSELRL